MSESPARSGHRSTEPIGERNAGGWAQARGYDSIPGHPAFAAYVAGLAKQALDPTAKT
jgi:hypothetical protein